MAGCCSRPARWRQAPGSVPRVGRASDGVTSQAPRELEGTGTGVTAPLRGVVSRQALPWRGRASSLPRARRWAAVEPPASGRAGARLGADRPPGELRAARSHEVAGDGDGVPLTASRRFARPDTDAKR